MASSAFFLATEREQSELLIVLGFPLRDCNPIVELWEKDGSKVMNFWHEPESTEEGFEDVSATAVLREYHQLPPRDDEEPLTEETQRLIRFMRELHETQETLDSMLGVTRERPWDEEGNRYKGGDVIPLVKVDRDGEEVMIPSNATPEVIKTLEDLAERV